MSLEVNIEKFSKLSSIFKEIERIGERRRSREAVKSQKAERKSRSSTVLTPLPAKRHNLGRPKSDPTGHTLKEAQPRERIQSAPPCTVIDRNKILNDSRLTEAAKQLTDGELALLYEDILRPLDFYAMLQERRKKL